MTMTNYDWIKQASKKELAEELQAVANWSPKERAKIQFYKLDEPFSGYENFYEYWLAQPRVENANVPRG